MTDTPQNKERFTYAARHGDVVAYCIGGPIDRPNFVYRDPISFTLSIGKALVPTTKTPPPANYSTYLYVFGDGRASLDQFATPVAHVSRFKKAATAAHNSMMKGRRNG